VNRAGASGHALLSVLLAVMLTALGAAASLRATNQSLLHERAQRQRWEVSQHLLSAVDAGPASSASGAPHGKGTVHQLSDGTELTIEIRRWASAQGEPVSGLHFTAAAGWTDPWGVDQVLMLQSYWYAGLRLH